MPKSTTRTKAQRKSWSQLSGWMKKKIRSNPQSKFARRCRREYKYMCALTSKKRSLEAHHLFFRHTHPERSDDVDNGLLLDRKSHDELHNLFIKDELAYWKLAKTLVAKRTPIKSLKGIHRNPSLFDYQAFWATIPD